MRIIPRLFLLGASLAFAGVAAAQPVTRIIVPAPAGGGTDAFFRVIGKEAEAHLKGPVIIANVAGAGGTIGVGQMVTSKPDGYTLAGVWSSPLTASPHAMKASYTPADYIPVIQLSQSPYVFCVAPEFPAKDGKGLVEELRRNPDKYTYGNDGIGGTGQLAAQRIFRALGVKVRDVPFKGAGETLTNFLGGHVNIYVGSISPIMPSVKSGKARCLMLTSAERTPVFPEASGLKDLGIGGEETLLWRAVLAPKGTAPEVVKRIEEGFEAAMKTPATRKFCEEAGEDIVIRKGADLRKMLDAEYTALGAVAKSLNLAQ
jgi:tripartite-type tricarboxylate transporter receptor subunit TctC